MIDIQFRLDVIASQYAARKSELFTALAARMDELNLRLQQRIQTRKLSGHVLHQRSGKLKRSIEVILAKVRKSEGKITGGVRGAGGPAYYGRFHEFGTEDSYTILPVTKKALRFMIGHRAVFAARVNHPPIAERSFMRSAQEEMKDEFVKNMQQAVYQVFSARPR